MTRDGTEYVGYEYRVSILNGYIVQQQKLFLHAATALPVRQEVEYRHGGTSPFGPLFRTEIDFQFDASIKIEPQ